MRNLFSILVILFFCFSAGTEADQEEARRTFERLKGMKGAWEGVSSKGWKEEIEYDVIARGSVVMSRTFDAHPGETMLTMYYLDKGRLMLTHFCVARNQPRLVADTYEEDGTKITFRFLDGTGLQSRDQGHMDKMVLKLVDENHAVAQWTWYQDGEERWLEEIHLERK